MNPLLSDLAGRRLSKVELFFARDVYDFKRRLKELAGEIDPAAEPQKGDRYYRRLAEAFLESQDACRRFEFEHGDDPRIIKDVQDGFRMETASLLNRSWIINRTRTKPSGFAGDYQMLSAIYDQATPARGLGGYLDTFLLDLPLGRAVRMRLKAVEEFLIQETRARGGDLRILDIACGPCREYLNWPERCGGGKLEVIALDNDPMALDYVDTQVASRLPAHVRVQTARYNVLRTRRASATISKFGRFDIVYSVGLCDYLPDAHLIELLSAWRETLSDGGVLYVAFKDCMQYDKTPYQWHLDWFFLQRTMDDCLRLYRRAGLDANKLQTTRDETGIIINLISRPAQRRINRADVPTGAVTRLGLRSPLSMVEPREKGAPG